MNDYYVVQSTLGPRDLLRLGISDGTCSILNAGPKTFEKYTDFVVLINENIEEWRYHKFGIRVLKRKILEFNDDEEAVLWFKLNY